MKNVEFKLLVEDEEVANFTGKYKKSLTNVNWDQNRIYRVFGINQICSDAYEMEKRILENARRIYPNKNISAVLNIERHY